MKFATIYWNFMSTISYTTLYVYADDFMNIYAADYS